MKFKIPFTISEINKLKKRSLIFSSRFHHKKNSKLDEQLKSCDVGLTREEYLGICLKTFIFSFLTLFVISTTFFIFLNINLFYLLGLGIALVFSTFIFFSQRIYPSIYISRKQKNVEKNLIPALQDMLIQLNSGIPLFSIMTNLSSSDYGELSAEFKKAVKRINAGEEETSVLDEIGKRNPSVFFRRALWQISNGMRAGSDMSSVIRDSVKSLNDEQAIQIQSYGNKLNPLIVFYMLTAVIIPTLSVIFLTILSSMIKVQGSIAIMMFIGLFVFISLLQIMFLGMIKSKRPSLL